MNNIKRAARREICLTALLFLFEFSEEALFLFADCFSVVDVVFGLVRKGVIELTQHFLLL